MKNKQELGKYQLCEEMKKKVEDIDNTVEEQRDTFDRKEEAYRIIVGSLTTKFGQIEENFEKFLHEQVFINF